MGKGQTLAQKILARHVDRERVEIGEVIFPKFDFYICQEMPFPEFWKETESMGVTELANPDRMIIVADHEVPVLSMKGRNRWTRTLELIDQLRIKHVFKPGNAGIQHLLLPEKGFILPGHLTCSFDVHALNFGALGCYPFTAVYEFPAVMATGTIWLTVPETILVHLDGKLPYGCGIRDLALCVIGMIDAKMADSRAIQFTGSGVSELSVNERMILCGVMTELGVETTLIEPDEKVFDYVEKVAVEPFVPLYGDKDASYAAEYHIDLGELEPMIAKPPNPDNVVPLHEVAGLNINSAYIGSCQSGTIEELRAAAEILKGRKVHPDVPLLIVPSTQETYRQAAEEGLVEVFAAANAMMLGPTCSPCFGMVFQMEKGEVRITTATRNDRGRMGSLESDIYLAGASVVAASAVMGKVTDPQELMV
ncbi:aconitase/3-isopropylmalate dehydratase large subunit family protein [Bacillus sp. FJAT-50079]|uniref:3-isopropylmalate dehydratase large subunit n=1 Tax=Bacillus sp. FJAT-50079 TaxID=2833577 RepID=UPI001BC9B6F2|nr:3-isopropylmalate dehydratase large subunit [Bacillus sp. FJAT-50079]